MGYGVIVAAGMVLIYLLRQLPKLLRRMEQGGKSGKWVNDRSLGGKAVSFSPLFPHNMALSLFTCCRTMPFASRTAAGGHAAVRGLSRLLHSWQIFIPDAPSTSVGKGYDLATAEERNMARERATVQVGAPRQQSSFQGEEQQLPEWWNPTPALHVSLYYKEEVSALLGHNVSWCKFCSY